MKLARMMVAAGAAMAMFSGAAQAGEGLFGWTYTLDLQPKGKLEFEQRADVTHGQAVGKYDLGLYRSEIEYGLTNDVQVGFYLNAYSIRAKNNYLSPDMCDTGTIPCTAGFAVPSTAHDTGAYSRSGIDGGSLELIWRITNPVTSPVGLGVYIEPTFGKLEDELEFRFIAQSNFLDDRLIFTANLLLELEKEKYDTEIIRNSMADLLYGVSYRFAPKWSAGIEGRFHTDHDGYNFDQHTQTARFIGPVLHYAEKNWWVTAAWRHQIGGACYSDGMADCAVDKVWDNHGRNQYMIKFGIPLN